MPQPNPINSFGRESGIVLQSQVTTLNTWTGNSTGIYYPYKDNPSGYVREIEGSIYSTGFTGNILDGQLLIGSTGDNAYVRGNLIAVSGLTLVSGSGSLRIAPDDTIVKTGQTGLLTNVFYPLNSNPAGYLTAAGAGGVRYIIPTGTITSGLISGNVIVTGAGNVSVFTGISGHVVVSGDTGAYSVFALKSETGQFVTTAQTGNFVTTGQTGLLTNVFYPLNSNPSNYLTVSNNVGVRMIVPTGTINSGQISGNVIITGAGTVSVYTGLSGLIVISGTAVAGPGGAAGVNTIGATGITNTGYFTGDVLFSGAGNIVALTGNNNNKLIIISGDTGAYAVFTLKSETGGYTGTFYPLYQNPSGYISSVSGILTVSGSTGIQDGQLLIGSTGDNAFIQGNLAGSSGVFVQSGSGSLIIGADSTIVRTNQTGGFLTLGNVGGVRTLQTTGAFPSGTVSGNVIISGIGTVSVTTGAAGQIVISGAATAQQGGGVTSLAATGTTNTGFFTGDIMLSGAGSIVVSTGNQTSKVIVISGAGGSSIQVTGGNVSNPNFSGVGNVTVTTGGGGLVLISGNTTGISSLNKMWVPAAAMTPSQITGATTGQIFPINSGHTIDTLNFLSGSGQSAYFNLSFPRFWDKGTVTPMFYWSTTGNVGTINWGIAAGNIDDGTPLNIFYNQGATITDSTISGNHLHQTTGVPLTISGTLNDDDQCYFKVYRSAGGTLADEAKLIGVGLAYTETGVSAVGIGGQTFQYIQFTNDTNNPTYQEGRLFYDTGEKALSYYNEVNGVTLNIGQENWVRAANIGNATIANGQAVFITGTVSGLPTIALAKADTETGSFAIGITTVDIPQGGIGYVTTAGIVHAINVSGFTPGSKLFLSNVVPGGFTGVSPTSFVKPLGYVLSTGAFGRTGNVLVVPSDNTQPLTGTNEVWIPVGAMTPDVTNSPTTGIISTGGMVFDTLDFKQDGVVSAYFNLNFPMNWNTSLIKGRFHWTETGVTGTTGTVVWGLAGIARKENELFDVAFGTGQQVTGISATGLRMHTATTPFIAISGATGGALDCFFKAYRYSGSLSGNARLIGLSLQYYHTGMNNVIY